MKKLLFSLGALLLLSCSNKEIATVSGTLCDYKGDGYFLIIDNNRNYDTVTVEANGNFCHEIECSQATSNGLYLEYLGDDRTVINVHLTPGSNINVIFDGSIQEVEFMKKKEKRYVVTPTFSGDNIKECEYLNIPPYYDYHYVNEDGSPVTYKAFLSQVKQRQDYLINKLKGCSEQFRSAAMEEIDAMPQGLYFTFARISFREGYNASKDEDFLKAISDIDINNPDLCSGYQFDNVISSYIDYDLNIANPDLYAGKHPIMRTLMYLDEKVENPVVKEKIADNTINLYMTMGETDGLNEFFEFYRSLSGKSDSFKRNETVYNNLKKLLPGVMATNFTMQDTDGNSIQFLDVIGKGKITYIDFWATWCGPCCMEIPYVEKLVEHYKGNDQIEMLSISLDNDREKWIKKLDKDKPSWRQYIIPEAFNSEFAIEYNITGIPRFMIFDGEGKIITINADRPSSENIVKYLDNIIAGK